MLAPTEPSPDPDVPRVAALLSLTTSIMGIINPRMLVPPVLVYFIRNNLDIEDPETINWIRLTYGVAQAVMLTLLCYITCACRP